MPAHSHCFISFFQLSLVSATSFESRYGAQVFATTAHYKGNAVRIKELKFSKKKDISRDIMKEMRLLREIRNDNINLFLGAAIEPMRILLLTDYCVKGSLYVSKLLQFGEYHHNVSVFNILINTFVKLI